MNYLPAQTSLQQSSSGPEYNLEVQFITAVRASSYMSDSTSPEYQFIQLYDKPPTSFQTIFLNYFGNIQKQLKTLQGISNYLMLAEARRRIYRPLPLDEFGAQLPYALSLTPSWQGVEIASDGTITAIPQRGLDIFANWTGTLHRFDAHVLPLEVGKPQGIVLRPTASICPMMMRKTDVIPKHTVSDKREILHSATKPDATAKSPSSLNWDDDVASIRK